MHAEVSDGSGYLSLIASVRGLMNRLISPGPMITNGKGYSVSAGWVVTRSIHY